MYAYLSDSACAAWCGVPTTAVATAPGSLFLNLSTVTHTSLPWHMLGNCPNNNITLGSKRPTFWQPPRKPKGANAPAESQGPLLLWAGRGIQLLAGNVGSVGPEKEYDFPSNNKTNPRLAGQGLSAHCLVGIGLINCKTMCRMRPAIPVRWLDSHRKVTNFLFPSWLSNPSFAFLCCRSFTIHPQPDHALQIQIVWKMQVPFGLTSNVNGRKDCCFLLIRLWSCFLWRQSGSVVLCTLWVVFQCPVFLRSGRPQECCFI